MTAANEWTEVPTAAGTLRGLFHLPEAATGPLPGLALVDGSGDGACDDWGEWPQRFVDSGAVVLTHDKPGCGGSPGDWTTQSFTDRARESLAALEVLRRHPAVDGQPVGLLGVSQGGWVSLLAATLDPSSVGFVVSISGPGVTPAVQDRWRIDRELRSRGFSEPQIDEALGWIDARSMRLVAGEDAAAVLADQERFADRPWYEGATAYLDTEQVLRFLALVLDFDPARVLPDVRCPVLALFGGNDTMVPVPQSVVTFATRLPELPGAPHGIAVFPGADHGLFTADPDPNIPRTDQLAPGFLPMLARFLSDARSGPV